MTVIFGALAERSHHKYIQSPVLFDSDSKLTENKRDRKPIHQIPL